MTTSILHTGKGQLVALSFDSANAMTTAGAVSLDTYATLVNTTTGSGHASTLADGSIVGQVKVIRLAVDGGDLVLTVASLDGGDTITFGDAGDYVMLCWDGYQWNVLDSAGIAVTTA